MYAIRLLRQKSNDTAIKGEKKKEYIRSFPGHVSLIKGDIIVLFNLGF